MHAIGPSVTIRRAVAILEKGPALSYGAPFRPQQILPADQQGDHEDQHGDTAHAQTEERLNQGTGKRNQFMLGEKNGVDHHVQQRADYPRAPVGHGRGPWSVRVRQ